MDGVERSEAVGLGKFSCPSGKREIDTEAIEFLPELVELLHRGRSASRGDASRPLGGRDRRPRLRVGER